MYENSDLLDFENFVDSLHNFFIHVEFWKNNATSVGQKLFDIILNVSMLTLSILLIISETIDIKNSYDLPSFAAHINPICFHLNGLLKWCFGLMKLNDVENLLVRMKRCHRICLDYIEDKKGNKVLNNITI